MSAGYSQKPLVEKLGADKYEDPEFINKPKSIIELKEFSSTDIKSIVPNMYVHFFTRSKNEYKDVLPILVNNLKAGGMLWVSWPKGSSKLDTDMNENIVRDLALPTGIVDVKVAAIDEDWSGLKFMWRKNKEE